MLASGERKGGGLTSAKKRAARVHAMMERNVAEVRVRLLYNIFSHEQCLEEERKVTEELIGATVEQQASSGSVDTLSGRGRWDAEALFGGFVEWQWEAS
jgi:SRSO17 transposase